MPVSLREITSLSSALWPPLPRYPKVKKQMQLISRIQLRDFLHRQLGGVQHVSQIAILSVPRREDHQADGVASAISPVLAQPDDGIQQTLAIIVGQHLFDLVGGPLLEARDPEVALLSQIIKPGKAEIAQ